MSIWAQNLVDVSKASEFRLANSRGTLTCIPTNNNTPSFIDLTFHKNASTALTNWTTLPDHRTLDHVPITFSLSPTEGTSSRYQGFNWNKTEWHLVNNFLPLQARVESEEDFNHLFHITLRAIKSCTPQRTINKWTRPWWNPDLAELRKVKNSITRDFRLGKCNKNTANAARNAYLRAIRKAASEHWNTLVDATTPANLWNTVKKAFPKDPPSLATINGATTFQEKADVLREHLFPPPPPSLKHTPSQDMTGFVAVTLDEITKAINAIPALSAPGDDTIPTLVWKNLHNIRPDVLTVMCTWSLQNRTLPSILKKTLAVVIPKPGKPDYSIPKAYRMISLLPTLSKVIEHITLARLTVFAPRVLSRYQFGSRKKYSALDAVHLLLETATHAAQYGKFTSALLRDVMGAFDKVLHGRLVAIMTEGEFPPYLVDWVQSYLSGRSIRITDGAASENQFTPVTVGIPQGSPLSPFLFNVYSSQLFSFPARHRTDLKVSYVDDFALVVKSNSWLENARILSLSGNEIQTQANSGGMHFDISKTDLFHFPCKNVIPNKDTAPVTINGHTILNSTEQRWVGVWLTNNLRPLAHIAQRAAYASTRFYKLVPLLKRLRPEVASRLVKATVIPTLTFGLEIYARAHINEDELAPIRICLHMAAQIITGGWKKSDLKALWAEAGLHSPLILTK